MGGKRWGGTRGSRGEILGVVGVNNNWISPPKRLGGKFWRGNGNFWRGTRQNRGSPPKCWGGTSKFGVFPPSLGGNQNSSPPNLRKWGGTKIPTKLGGETWGGTFFVGGEIRGLVPPHLGGKWTTMPRCYSNYSFLLNYKLQGQSY